MVARPGEPHGCRHDSAGQGGRGHGAPVGEAGRPGGGRQERGGRRGYLCASRRLFIARGGCRQVRLPYPRHQRNALFPFLRRTLRGVAP
ncbi:hypothetical protein F6V25_12910 [Oryzomonas japonica]|uniref:Uncharacterized protein n=1 Tax=Oryzomonas japonica TaxID=2603858 RepID=A0A7J4ZNQ6_9BACT|nr:hypothetical protein F6V25_12910 [Oryzomonas japonica]